MFIRVTDKLVVKKTEIVAVEKIHSSKFGVEEIIIYLQDGTTFLAEGLDLYAWISKVLLS